MKLSGLSKELKCKFTSEAEIGGICTDSRLAGEGDLFVCFQGTNVHSDIYAEEAIARGAAAICTEQPLPINCPQLVVKNARRALAVLSAAFYHHPEREMKIVGITGTNGKTTTSYLLKNILLESGFCVGVIGTLGALYCGKRVQTPLTTPDPPFLYALLSDMQKAGVQIVIMEVSAHALALEKDAPIFYDVGVFTNLTRDHLDFFPDMERYGEAKKKLFVRCGYGVFNAEDEFSDHLKNEKLSYTDYALNAPSEAFAVIEEQSLEGYRLLLNLNDELAETTLHMIGKYNIMNALAASCAARKLGADMEVVARGIEKTKGVDGRLERVASYRGADIFVDFAHTPDGLIKSISALKEFCEGRLILLFGCGGNRDEGKREKMGECAARLCDFCVITSDNPRYEDPVFIISEIERGFQKISHNYVAVEEREKATEYAVSKLRKGDILLVAGKGAESYQEIMGIKYDYNDKAVIKKVLEKCP